MRHVSAVIAAIDELEASDPATQWAVHDELINSSLEEGPGFDDYARSWHNQEGDLICTVCMDEWHGLAKPEGCPSEFADQATRTAYQEHQRSRRASHFSMSTNRDPWIPGRDCLLGDRVPDPTTDTSRITIASPQMREALNEHINRYPQDEEQLMRRYRRVLFGVDGRPVPYTRDGLVNVLRPDPNTPPEWHVVEWAQRQMGVVVDDR